MRCLKYAWLSEIRWFLMGMTLWQNHIWSNSVMEGLSKRCVEAVVQTPARCCCPRNAGRCLTWRRQERWWGFAARGTEGSPDDAVRVRCRPADCLSLSACGWPWEPFFPRDGVVWPSQKRAFLFSFCSVTFSCCACRRHVGRSFLQLLHLLYRRDGTLVCG